MSTEIPDKSPTTEVKEEKMRNDLLEQLHEKFENLIDVLEVKSDLELIHQTKDLIFCISTILDEAEEEKSMSVLIQLNALAQVMRTVLFDGYKDEGIEETVSELRNTLKSLKNPDLLEDEN